jgi:hypothetical protein
MASVLPDAATLWTPASHPGNPEDVPRPEAHRDEK